MSQIPPAVRALLIANAAIFVAQRLVLDVGSPDRSRWIIETFGLVPERVVFGGAVWQLATHQFLHDPLWILHVVGNCWTLWVFGCALERTWGMWRFLRFYLLCGLWAGATNVIAAYLPGQDPEVPVIGASGAVLGVLAAYATCFPDARIVIFPIPMPVRARPAALLYAALTVWLAASGSAPDIAHWAHLGGLATGWFLVHGRVLAVGCWDYLLWRLRIRPMRVVRDWWRAGPVPPP